MKEIIGELTKEGKEILKEVWTPQQTADFLHCSTSRLAKFRCLGTGIKFLKDGGRILYSKEEILKYLEGRSHGSTSEYETSPGTGRPRVRNGKNPRCDKLKGTP